MIIFKWVRACRLTTFLFIFFFFSHISPPTECSRDKIKRKRYGGDSNRKVSRERHTKKKMGDGEKKTVIKYLSCRRRRRRRNFRDNNGPTLSAPAIFRLTPYYKYCNFLREYNAYNNIPSPSPYIFCFLPRTQETFQRPSPPPPPNRLKYSRTARGLKKKKNSRPRPRTSRHP